MREGVKKRVREKKKEREGGGERERGGGYIAGSQDFYVRILDLETILPITQSIITFLVDI